MHPPPRARGDRRAPAAAEGVIETYIVRIWRDEEREPAHLVGDVEVAGIEGRRSFRSREELWRLLCEKHGRAAARRGTTKEPGMGGRA